MAPKIGIQLYNFREYTQTDFASVTRKVAAMGYDGVEPAGFGNSTATEAKKLFDELGLGVAGSHGPFPLGEHEQEVIENTLLFGLKYVTVATIPPEAVKDTGAIAELCDRLNRSQQNVDRYGLTVVAHNHFWEYARMDGKLIADIMIEQLDPKVSFELDTYWIKSAGEDPTERVRTIGKRSPLLHIKDGDGSTDHHLALGDGIMDFDAIYQAGGKDAEWWIYEADRPVGDIFDLSQRSYDFMKRILR